MDATKVDMFFAMNGKKLPVDKALIIREKLEAADDSKYAVVSSVELKDPTTMLLVSVFVGELGVDRFMLGQIGMGLLKLFTLGLCGVLWLIDVINISKKTKEANFEELIKVL